MSRVIPFARSAPKPKTVEQAVATPPAVVDNIEDTLIFPNPANGDATEEVESPLEDADELDH